MNNIIEAYDPRTDCVSNLRGRVTEENEVVLYWDWPENEEYNLCVVFEVDHEEETCDGLLKRGAKKNVYGSSFGVCHKAPIPDSYVQFKLFPAKKENGVLYVVNQRKDNLSEVYLRRTKLFWRVEYDRPELFSKYRKARIILDGGERQTEGYWYYRCLGGSNQNYLYGIDRSRFKECNVFEVTVEKTETIELVLGPAQEKYMELVRR